MACAVALRNEGYKVAAIFFSEIDKYIGNLQDMSCGSCFGFFDELFQPNAIDKDGINREKCDESWSLDNLRVRAIKYQ